MQNIQVLTCNRAAGLLSFNAVMMWEKVGCRSGGSGFDGPVAVARRYQFSLVLNDVFGSCENVAVFDVRQRGDGHYWLEGPFRK